MVFLLLSDSEKAAVTAALSKLVAVRSLSHFQILLYIQRVYGVQLPSHAHIGMGTTNDCFARGTAVPMVLQTREFNNASEFIRPLEIMATETTAVGVATAAATQALNRMAVFVHALVPSSLPADVGESDGASVLKLVFDRTQKRWIAAAVEPDGVTASTSVSRPHVTRFTFRNVANDLADHVREARSMLLELKSTREPDRVAALLDSLGFLQGHMQSLADSLQHQRTLSELVAAQYEEDGKASPDIALDAGDLAYLSLLDFADPRLSAREKVAVANLFARPQNKHDVSLQLFRRAVELHLGARVLSELQRVGMA